MAAAVISFLSTVGAAIGGALGATLIMQPVAFLLKGAIAIGLSAYSSHQRRKAARAARDAWNRSLKDRNITVRGALEPRQAIYGRCRAGGALVYIASSGDNKEKLTLVVALAAHEIDAIEAVYLNEEAVTLDASGWAQGAPYLKTRKQSKTVSVAISGGNASYVAAESGLSDPVWTVNLGNDNGSNSKAGTIAGSTISVTGLTGSFDGLATLHYSYTSGESKARIRWMLGSENQTAFADLVSAFPEWTSAHRMRGVPYLVCEFTYDQDAFPSGVPNVSALVRGAKVRDLRHDRVTDKFCAAVTPAIESPMLYERVGDGSEDGVPYSDWRFHGTNTSGSTAYLTFSVASVTSGVAAGQTWAAGVYLRTVAGSTAGLQLAYARVSARDSGGVFLGSLATDTTDPSADRLRSQRRITGTYTLPAGSGQVRCDLVFYADIGATVDVTLRVGAPQLWRTTDIADVQAWSENPALCMMDYLLRPFGGRRSLEQLDEPTFIAAANVCDTIVDYGTTLNVKQFTLGLVIPTDAVPADALDEMAETMAGRWGYSGGIVRARSGSLAATAATIDKDWLVGEAGVSIQPRRPRSELRNVIQGTFIDPGQSYSLVPFERVVDAPGVAEDGSDLVGEVEFAGIQRWYQAQQVAAVMLRADRMAMVVRMTCNMRAYPLQIHDVVAVTLDRFGWSALLFEVIERSFSAGGGIDLTLKRTEASVFAIGTTFPANVGASNTRLPKPWQVVTPPAAATATSGTGALVDNSIVSRVAVAWAQLADEGVTSGGFIELAYVDSTQAQAFKVVRADSLTGHSLFALRVNTHYLFKFRGVNGAGVRGDWSPVLTHKVIGPTYLGALDATRNVVLQGLFSARPTGADGDFYYATDTAVLYQKVAGAWVVAANNYTNTNQITDGALLGETATWTGVSGTGKPQDNATANPIYQQATAPSGTIADGAIWIDTDDKNKMYLRSGGAWVLRRDQGVDDALTAAANAQDTADGKIESFYQASAPATGMSVGDLWFDTDAGNAVYRYSGSAWVSAKDSGIGQALGDAATAQATADGKVTTFFTTSTPTADAIGDLWYSTSTALLKRWSGSAWITVSNSFSNTTQLLDDALFGETATWTGVTGTGKPQDNATVGADWATNVSNRPVLTETFEDTNALAKWVAFAGSGEASVVSVADSQTGGKVLRVGNNSGNDELRMAHASNIPFDPAALYRIRVRVRRVSGTGTLYLGVNGVAADGVSWANTVGDNSAYSQHYVGGNNEAPGSSWTEYVGYFRGTAATGTSSDSFDPSSPGKLHDSVRYFRAMFIANYAGVAGSMEFDLFAIERLDGAMATLEQITTSNASTYIQAAAIGWAQIGNLVISTTGAIRSGQTAWNTGSGWWLGYDAGEPALSIGDTGGYLTYKPSAGLAVKFVSFTAAGISDITVNTTTTGTWLTLATRTLTPTNGLAPYTYAWSLEAYDSVGGYVKLETETAATVTVKGKITTTSSWWNGRLTGVITDANGRTAGASCTVLLRSTNYNP